MSRPNQTAKPPPTIFICYRRAETEAYAARVRDALKSHFGGRARVFRDYDDIPAGVDFVEAIRDAIGASAALIAIIGKQWASIRDEETGRPRLEQEKDHVRAEVVSALKAGVRVIPVLVQDAQMPGETHLPDDLKPLATINALELSSKRWDYDSRKLIETIESSLPAAKRAKEGPPLLPLTLSRASRLPLPWRAAITLVAAAAVGFGAWKMMPEPCHLADVPGIENVSDKFKAKVCRIASRLDADPNYLMAVMSYQTGGSFAPASRGTMGGVGLLRFYAGEAEQMGATTEALAAMSAERQLDVVEKFYTPYKDRLRTMEDVYMARLYPPAVGGGSEYVIYEKGDAGRYELNIPLDLNKDEKVTASEATARMRNFLNKAADSTNR